MLKRIRSSFRSRRASDEQIGTSTMTDVAAATGTVTGGNGMVRRSFSDGDHTTPTAVGVPRAASVGGTSQAAMQAAALRMSVQMRQRVLQRRASVSNFLNAPLTTVASNNGTAHGLVWAEACMQGWRSHMEDAYIAKSDFKSMPGWSFFAILDGHAGKVVAQVSAETLPHAVEAFVSPVRYSPRGLMDGMRRGFLRHDKQLERNFEVLRDQSGTTCTSVLVGPSQIVLVNIGDSRIVMCRGGRPIVCTMDHKPSDQKELMRIQNAGGRVINNRVDGGLALSRAFGDFEYKMRSDLLQTQQKVTAEPDSIYIRRSPHQDDFLLIACDGLWDVMSNEQACQTVYTLLRRKMTPNEICKNLVKSALVNGSRDNISVLLVFFKRGHTPDQTDQEVVDGIATSVARYTMRQALSTIFSNAAYCNILSSKGNSSDKLDGGNEVSGADEHQRASSV